MIGTLSSMTHLSLVTQQEEEAFIVIPSTFTYASDWVSGQTGFGHGGVGRQVESSPSVPTVYHVETRLPNGSLHYFLISDQSEISLVTSGCGNKPPQPCERDCDPSSVAGNVH